MITRRQFAARLAGFAAATGLSRFIHRPAPPPAPAAAAPVMPTPHVMGVDPAGLPDYTAVTLTFWSVVLPGEIAKPVLLESFQFPRC